MPKKKRYSSISDDNLDEHTAGETNDHWRCAEKSRKAAKSRRDQENIEMEQLASLLPLTRKTRKTNMDKAAILRFAINYLRLKQFTKPEQEKFDDECNQMVTPRKINNGLNLNEGQLMLNALNGFLLFINKKGVIYYVSQNVAPYTGIDQEDMVGRSLFNFIHQDDYKEVIKQFSVTCGNCCNGTSINVMAPVGSVLEDLTSSSSDEDDEEIDEIESYIRERLFYVRFKCYYQKLGTKSRHTTFKLMQLQGRMKLQVIGNKRRALGLVAVCRPMQTLSFMDVRIDGNMFTSKHKLDMRFICCDARILTLVGYDPNELIGKTAYQFHNPLDAPKIYNCHKNLIAKGTSVSKYYRFLGKTGVWVWMQTRATIIHNSANNPDHVVCMNYIISEQEGHRYLMMEQEERGGMKDDSDVPGAIDLTALNSPTAKSAVSSGYSSGDEDHLSPSVSRTGSTSTGVIQDSNCMSFQPEELINQRPSSSTPSGLSGNVFVASFDDLDDFLDMSGFGTNTLTGIDNSPSCSTSSCALPSLANYYSNYTHGRSSFKSLVNDNFSNDIEMMDIDLYNRQQTPTTKSVTVTIPVGANVQTIDTKGLLVSTFQEAQDHGQLSSSTSALAKGYESRNVEITIDDLPSQITGAQSSVNWDVGQQCFESNNLGQGFSTMDISDDLNNLSDIGMPSHDHLFGNDLAIPPQLPGYEDLMSVSPDITSMLFNDVNMASSILTSNSQAVGMVGPANQETAVRKSAIHDGIRPSFSQKQCPYPGKNGQTSNSVYNRCSYNTNTISHSQSQIDVAATYRVLDDHSYTSKAPPHIRFSLEEKARKPTGSTLLEQFLVTKKHLDPKQSSDFISSRLMQLHLADAARRKGPSAGLNGIRSVDQPNLLKKLLTEESRTSYKPLLRNSPSAMSSPLTPHRLPMFSSPQHETNRQNSEHMPLNHVLTNNSKSVMSSGICCQNNHHMTYPQTFETENTEGLFKFMENIPLPDELDLLDSIVDGNSLWTNNRTSSEVSFTHELHESVREQNRHDDEWIKEFLDCF